jgi:hypothetical protein
MAKKKFLQKKFQKTISRKFCMNFVFQIFFGYRGSTANLGYACENLGGLGPLVLEKIKNGQFIFLIIIIYLDATIPKFAAKLHPFFQKILLCRGHINLGLIGADWRLLFCHSGLHNRKEPLDANADTNARHISVLRIKHTNELVIAASASNTANADLLALLVLVGLREVYY